VTVSDRLAEADEDAILPVSIGTTVWLVVLVVLLFQRDALDAHGTGWWIGAAAAGLITGAGGVLFLRWRKSRSAH
jgi:ABC-type nickel/cobalt efflux system permease component RcnA